MKVIWDAVRRVEVMFSEAFISEGEVFIEKEEGCGPDPVDRQHERYNAADAGMISTPITLFGQTRNLRENLSAQYSQWTHQLINTQ